MRVTRAVVVDDEAISRRRLIRLLAERDDVELVAECSGGRAAVETIARARPDLVFLDVQMPDLNGFEVLQQAIGTLATPPAIVFVTAYDQYAVQAFEASAVDYLLKPFTSERFDQALDRALRWMAAGTASEDDERMKRLLREVLRSEGHFLDAAESRGARLDRFMVKRNGKSEFIRAADVDWIESDGNYVRLHVGPQSHLVRGTVVTCADRLDARQFVRIHRRFIINIDRVKEVQPWFGGDHVIVLTSGQRLRLSRNFREHFQSRMVGD